MVRTVTSKKLRCDTEVESRDPAKRTKCLLSADGPCTSLRSGPVVRHRLIVEAATMQVTAMSGFALSAPDSPDCTPTNSSILILSSQESSQESDTSSSDPSVIAVWSQESTQPEPLSATLTSGFAAHATDLASAAVKSPQPVYTARCGSSPDVLRGSEVITKGLEWSPSPVRSRLHVSPPAAPRTPHGEIPLWFEDAFASDGYDSEALELIAGLHPHQNIVNHDEDVMAVSIESAVNVPGSCESSPRSDVWVSEAWPADVECINEQWNPRHWKFSPMSIGIRDGADCGCEERCNVVSCANAKESRFCMEANCAFSGFCGNALKEHSSLVVARNTRTGMRGLVAKDGIAVGEVLGEYFGHLDLFGPPCRNGPVNDGFRMHLKTRTTGNKYIGIDAKEMGGTLRFMNHA
ncbi:hypothetical protein PF001_g5789 [Phytophthora fragariae]|uniref:AWS domain-containing protein n=4 Tax=Phytophthora fragariae TaxID=53985 RepID=A0A6A3FSF3_9STRA|nr:hypothetical protein PF003_g38233 [Phytophthora fragariae]KAE8946980.1 hypothetical protein PF009_g3406 [Phytophthora fragariae]KAE9019870.1 hypothetical protein PF011_g5644 [Phytophthora fragariae]KAE9319637.1 hypothetical protein PF001_g5789 [Phytophthora fragariae]